MPKRNILNLLTLVLMCLFAQAALAASTPHWVHYKLLKSKPQLPKKIVVLPMNIEVLEVTAGDVKEMVPEWSKTAEKNIYQSVSAYIKRTPGLRQVKMPRLSKKENANMEEHMALYNLVVNTAANIDLEHKVRRFDYTIGPGLSSLRKKTGADAAVLIYGRDQVSTAGRVAQNVIANIPFIGIFAGQPARLGDSFIHVGIVDLRTGDLLWMNSEYRDDTTDIREFDDAKDMVETAFEWYPGIEEYRAAYVN